VTVPRTAVLSRSPGVLSRRVGSDVLVARLEAGDVHELSGGASALWQALDASMTLAELIDALADLHGVQRSEIAAQVEACVDSLVDVGVVSSHPAPDRADRSDGRSSS
jgi:hypothetical protein